MGCCSSDSINKNHAYNEFIDFLKDFDVKTLNGTEKERDKVANNIVIAIRLKGISLVEISQVIKSSRFSNFKTWYDNYGNGDVPEEGKRVLNWVENHLMSIKCLKEKPVIRIEQVAKKVIRKESLNTDVI